MNIDTDTDVDIDIHLSPREGNIEGYQSQPLPQNSSVLVSITTRENNE
jgi:hypothetical protein